LAGVNTVVNERWREGLASSLAVGIRESERLDPPCDGALISTADQPLVDSSALRALLVAFGGDARLVAAEYGGTIGVPAVIGREYFQALVELTGDAGAGRWLRARGDAVKRVPMPDAAMDVDDAGDLLRLEALV
jgi:molybdenum cofactor cytidylyltransferase